MEHDLVLADRHISEKEKIVDAQRMRIEQLQRHGDDPTTAMDTLRAFEQILKTLNSHRNHILRAIDARDNRGRHSPHHFQADLFSYVVLDCAFASSSVPSTPPLAVP
jgi:hypothetical protein